MYNLCLNENGVTELSIDHDDTDDIMDVGINEGMDIYAVINVAKCIITGAGKVQNNCKITVPIHTKKNPQRNH